VGQEPAPPLLATIRDPSGREIARGRSLGGYGSGPVRVPVPLVRRTVPGAEVCLRAEGGGRPALRGVSATGRNFKLDGVVTAGAVRLAYLRPGTESWLGLAPVVAHRFALAKTQLAGPWLFWVVLGLAAFAAALGLRAGLAPVRRAVLIIALAAMLNGVAWSLLAPPLQAFDEPVHVYYAQRLAVTGTVPRPIPGTVLPDEMIAVVDHLRVYDVAGNPEAHPPWTEAEDKALDRRLTADLDRISDGADGGVGVYPPLYYAAGALAYKATPTESLLDRMAVMRLVSCALAALTALFVCLFVRELLPRPEWAWRTAGVVAAFQPTFGFLSGVFNPDMGASAAAAALFYGLARAFRRGLTPRLAALIGLALAAGFLCKLALAGLVPGAVLAVVLLARRSRAWRAVGAFAAAAAVPVAAYVTLNLTVWDRPALLGSSAPSLANAPAAGAPPGGSESSSYLVEAFVYTWQVFLPRLPSMTDRAAGWPAWDRYFEGWVGRFGWGDYEFGAWVDAAAALVLAILLAASMALALRHGQAFAARRTEWLSYAVLCLGLLALLSYSGYDYVIRTGGGAFEQGRYMLPLHGLYAALVAAGLRGLGVRVGPVAAAVLVVAAVGHGVWAQLLTIARFYG